MDGYILYTIYIHTSAWLLSYHWANFVDILYIFIRFYNSSCVATVRCRDVERKTSKLMRVDDQSNARLEQIKYNIVQLSPHIS